MQLQPLDTHRDAGVPVRPRGRTPTNTAVPMDGSSLRDGLRDDIDSFHRAAERVLDTIRRGP